MRKPELPSISPKTRRTLIFLVTVAAGSLLILYDLPTEYLLGGTIAAGCIVLLAFGAIRLSDLRPKNIREGLKAWVAGRKQRPQKKDAPKEKIGSRTTAAPEEKGGRVRAALASLSGVVHGGAGRLKASLFHKDETFKKIDTILDAEIAGGAASNGPDTSAAVQGGENAPAPLSGAADPFFDISEEDLENLTLDGEEIDQTGSPVDITLDDEIPSLASNDSIVSEIFRANAAELEEFSELGDISELDETLGEIGGVDLDALDLSEEDLSEITPDTGSQDDAPEDALADNASILPEIPEEPEEEEAPEEENLVAFASGGGSDSLMDILKSDVKQRKKGDYNSLLRGMKGMKINADDLVDELEETLKALEGGSTVKKHG
ncbi:hypothetical protein [Methanofollis tationis]|uniref:Uncharacterized protein n=1 Tax=Methanofollis tationis TaxID=81417 RepID=A0A7K4HM83_9EURY|nr:hypothetical protein [Methanofollis tationis]NVO66376.1 hypothetical protein [Methanofollis tationis]